MRLRFAALLLVSCVRTHPATSLRAGSLDFGGRARTYVWAGPGGGRRPLVIALHGRGGTGAQLAAESRLDEVARREGFVVVFPDGVERSWADGRRGTPASQRGVDDVGFVGALIDRFVADGLADPTRVYATGMSNGAIMSYTLACAMPDHLAAVAPVAGALPEDMTCAPSRPIAVQAWNGTDDRNVRYEGGRTPSIASRLRSAHASMLAFATAAACAAAPVEAALPGRSRTETWTGCRDGVTVELVTIEKGGHTWPPEASEEMWRFFARQKLEP